MGAFFGCIIAAGIVGYSLAYVCEAIEMVVKTLKAINTNLEKIVEYLEKR